MIEGARLKQLRVKLNLTQSQLAQRILSNQTEISEIETGAIDLEAWSQRHPDRWASLKTVLRVDDQPIELRQIDGRWWAMVPSGRAEVCDRLPVGVSVVLV